ncbi:HAD family hydrolase [Aquicella siphonis]|nr:HAD family phosphatase [Aquicella siphonis]
MFKAVIFDFDGVILDSEPLHYQACCTVFKQLGYALSYDEYTEKYIGTSDKDMFPLLLKTIGLDFTSHEVQSLINMKVEAYIHIIRHHDSLPMIPDLDNYLSSINRDTTKIAICSGSTKNEIRIVLERLLQGRLQSLFDCIITSDDVTHGKPSPEGYQLTANRLGVKPADCLVIEDSPHGVRAAKSAGMYVTGLSTTYPASQLAHADKIVSGYRELMQLHIGDPSLSAPQVSLKKNVKENASDYS